MNSMAYETGLEWGYPEHGKDWQEAGTTCDFCKDDDSVKVAGVKDVVTKIIHLAMSKEKAMDMTERVVGFWANRIAGNLSVPENFDLHEEYDGFMIYSGGNDWEAFFRTIVVIPKRPLYESNSMVWIVVENPDKDNFDNFYDHGKKVYNKWKEEYRKDKKAGGSGLPAWSRAMKSESVSCFLEDCGESFCSWKENREKTGGLRRGHSVGVEFIDKGDIESSLLEALQHCKDVTGQI